MRLYFIFLTFTFLTQGFAQPIVVENKGYSSFPLLSQEEIDKLLPSNGQIVFNRTTGSINYWYNNNWFAVKGTCIPEPQIPKIDSITVENAIGHLYLTNSHDSLKLWSNKKWFYSNNQQLDFRVEPNNSEQNVLVSARNSCGNKDSVIMFTIKPFNITDVSAEKMNGTSVKVRKINTIVWMTEDYFSESQTMVNDKCDCPDGWELPSKEVWTSLLKNYSLDYSEMFMTPTSSNLSIGLGKKGVLHSKGEIGRETTGYYWVDNGGKGKRMLLLVSENGYMFVEDKTNGLRMSLRCIKNEKK